MMMITLNATEAKVKVCMGRRKFREFIGEVTYSSYFRIKAEIEFPGLTQIKMELFAYSGRDEPDFKILKPCCKHWDLISRIL